MAARGTESGQNAWEKTKDKYVEISQIVRADLKGWIVCLAVLIITVVRSGITYSFGMFVVELEKEFPDMTMAKQSKHSYCSSPKAVITIAIRLRYDYDPTTTYRARLLPFDAIRREQKTWQFFIVVVSYSRIAIVT